MAVKWLVLLTIIAILAGAAVADRCNAKLSCSDCYTTEGCVFCGAMDMNSTLSRCVSEENIPVVWNSECPLEDRYKAESQSTITDDGETGGRKIRLKPSKITVDLGKGQSHNITINVKVQDNPQLELYILMDLSRTMLDDKKTLEKILQELISELQARTTDLPRIGFGAFVEKPIRPYISLLPQKNNEACKDINCDAAWGFRHYKKLTDDADEVKDAIAHAPVAFNVDPQEGGFDGVMQSIVCKEVIGWTEGTEKMLVYLSDSAPHMAGDGKLAGILTPNDMRCHMEPEKGPGKNYTHVYSYSTIMDYPSVGQIAQKAEEKGMNVFFLARDKVIPLYKRISHNIKSSNYETIEEDSGNIVELITNEYEKIQQTLSLDDDAKEDLSLRYFSRCKKSEESELLETKECSNLEKNNEVEFIIEVTMRSCDTFQDGESQVIKIKSFGDDLNPMELTINPLCECDCENNNHEDYRPASEKCNFQGDMRCGVCKCDPGYGGKTCDCDKSDVDADGAGCRQGNSTIVCNERGSCECNECECEEGYTGEYCECDNNICKRGNGGKLCSGHGNCECGVCNCHNGWTGDACACSSETDNCINPANGETCTSNGACVCNSCVCNNTENSYTGAWCQTCIDCPKRCKELGPCVLCRHNAQGDSDPQCTEQCTQPLLQFTFLDKLDEPSEGEELCSTYDSDDCRISFVYGPGGDGGLHLKVLKKKACPTPPPILPIVLGIIGAIVVLGLIALLAWKCYANYLDRKAFEKFAMEQANAKWADNPNPLYKSPKTTVMNPVFGLKQD